MSRPSAEARPRPRSARRRLVEFAFAFCCVFAGLALPNPGIGPLYVRAHAAIGNALVKRELDSGVKLELTATREALKKDPWHATLRVAPPGPGVAPVLVPIDLRTLMFLPTVAFVALAAAAPMRSPRHNLIVLAAGLPLLELVLLTLTAVPMLSFLGGTGPILAFSLGIGTHTLLQIVYRALVAPPGMAFALPLFLWWLLVKRTGGLGGSEPAASPSTGGVVAHEPRP